MARSRKSCSSDRSRPKRTLIIAAKPAKAPIPVRGVRLKTVSLFTILFALSCLGAFMAGRTEMPSGSATAARGNATALMQQAPMHGSRSPILVRE